MKRVNPSLAMMLLALSVAHHRASAQMPAAVSGVVRDPHGVPQLGALVELLGAGSLVVAHTYTDDHGRYLLSVLEPGRYQLRTSAAFQLPALRSNLRLTAGGRTLADITLSALFGAGDWFPVEHRKASEPDDDWRWTLRSTAERPLLRLTDPEGETDQMSASEDGVSAEPSSTEATQRQERFQTAVGSAGLLQDGWRQTISLNQAYAKGSVALFQATLGGVSDGTSAASFSTSAGFEQKNPVTQGEFRTVASLAAYPEVGASGEAGYQAVNLATGERIVLGDVVTIDAGTLLSAERLVASRFSASPFLKVAIKPSPHVTVMYRYAGSRALQSLDDLDEGALQPEPLSDSSGRPLAHTSSHNEVAIGLHSDRNRALLAVYQDAFAAGYAEGGGGLSLASAEGLPVTENVANGTFVIGLRGYVARGVSGSWSRAITPALRATVQADFGTALEVNAGDPPSLNNLQNSVSTGNAPAIAAEVDDSIQATATSFDVRYRWQPARTLAVLDAFNTAQTDAYLGFSVKQGLWHGDRVRGISAVVEASNLLEEGYQPMLGPDGQTLFLAQVPRALQAGLVFSF